MKVCALTGGGKGIGRAIAEALAPLQYKIYLNGRDLKALEATARLIREKGGIGVPVQGDLAMASAIDRFAASITEERINVLINNAGSAIVKPFGEISPQEWIESLSLNLSAPFLLTQKITPLMGRGDTIVNILSIAAKQSFPNWSAYCAVKAGLSGLMKAIREELREREIRVVNIYSSAVDTSLWDEIPGTWDRSRMISPEGVAQAVVYAISRPPELLVEEISLGHISGTL